MRLMRELWVQERNSLVRIRRQSIEQTQKLLLTVLRIPKIQTMNLTILDTTFMPPSLTSTLKIGTRLSNGIQSVLNSVDGKKSNGFVFFVSVLQKCLAVKVLLRHKIIFFKRTILDHIVPSLYSTLPKHIG